MKFWGLIGTTVSITLLHVIFSDINTMYQQIALALHIKGKKAEY